MGRNLIRHERSRIQSRKPKKGRRNSRTKVDDTWPRKEAKSREREEGCLAPLCLCSCLVHFFGGGIHSFFHCHGRRLRGPCQLLIGFSTVLDVYALTDLSVFYMLLTAMIVSVKIQPHRKIRKKYLLRHPDHHWAYAQYHIPHGGWVHKKKKQFYIFVFCTLPTFLGVYFCYYYY